MTITRMLTLALLVFGLPAAAHAGCEKHGEAGDKPAQKIEAPSAYLESIETEADSGGVEDEVDSAQAQAEALEKQKH